MRLEPVLPSAVDVEPLLRGKAHGALVPAAAVEDADVGEELADADRVGTRNRHVVRRPWIRRDLVLAPARVAARVLLHLEDDEVSEAAGAQPPCRAETSDAAADD